ncbi:MAG: nucleotide pyrophosphatase/phosphodiesterase family protein [Verrucomicrobiota bacterium]
MKRVAVINVVGLTESLIGEHTPRIAEFQKRGSLAHITPAFPAVTCTAQSNYLTGALPSLHGIVGNGWYNRELSEIHFWKQSNHLVHGDKIWDELRALMPNFTCAKVFWWFNMHSSADYSITPRPMYPADGRKFFDIYTQPGNIRHKIKDIIGEFPFFGFWGPAAGVKTPQGSAVCATRWIADAAKWFEHQFSPTLNLIYLPHLDYNLQRHGPYDDSGNLNQKIHGDLRELDIIVGDLLDFFGERGIKVILLSEYGITNVNQPIHLNRLLWERGKFDVAVREELGRELLNPGASEVFAVTDHQIAHIYLKHSSLAEKVRDFVEKETGSTVLGAREKIEAGIDHPRAGDLIAIARENAWFTYYYWDDDRKAPDFARTVDIHRKPGYDPVELFLDPNISLPKLHIALRLLQKKLGFRMLMDVIPLDANLVKGSHGRRPSDKKDWPVLITSQPELSSAKTIESTDVYQILRRHVLG